MKNTNSILIAFARANVAKLEGTLEGCKKALSNCEFCYNDMDASRKRSSYGKFLKNEISRLNLKIFKFEEPELYASQQRAIKEFCENTHI